MVTARPGGGAVDRNVALPPADATSSFLISRPWLVGQRFKGDNKAVRQHLIGEIVKVETLLSTRVEAHPIILPPVSSSVVIGYKILPPSPRHSANDRLLVSFHFTVRRGVAVQVSDAGSDAVSVLIVMNPLPSAPLPHLHDWDIPIQEMEKQTDIITKVLIADAIGHPLAGQLLSRDWLTDRYDAPQASSAHDEEITRMAVSDLRGATPFSFDDSQPFPIYGQVRVQWERH
jgi:hypothetical protein